MQIGYTRTKLNTLVSFPTQGLDMTPYLAPRSSNRPSSATLQRRVQWSTSRTKTFASHSKSVRFEEDKSSDKSVSRNASSRFHFPWKKKKEEPPVKPPAELFGGNVCDSPSSVRSAPSVVGQRVSRGKAVHSPVHSLDGADMRSRSPANSDVAATTDNTYDLYAVCNHVGTMTRGHYTACCRNPADGHWYLFDDNHVQPATEEQLVTAGAYLLFYVRQSLLNQLPPLSSTSSSSSSSAGSNHWAMHMPRFRLDLNGSVDLSTTSNSNELKSRQRYGSTASAPPVSNGRGFSPLSSSLHDNESDVFVQNHSGPDVVSLPPSANTTPLHYRQVSSPPYQPPANQRFIANARHASLRVNKSHQPTTHESPAHVSEQFMRRGASFHGSRQQQQPKRSLTGSGRVFEMPAHPAYPASGNRLAMPSRSIPNMSADYAPESSHTPVPSHSIPDMSAHMSSPPVTRHKLPPDHTLHYMTPQPNRARTFSAGHNLSHKGAESCV